MKKTLSLVLAFSMVLTLLLPMGALAQGENPNQQLYDKLKGKFGSFSTSSDTAILAAQKLDGNNFYISVYNNSKTVLSDSKYDVLRNYLKNDLGLTSSEVEGLIKKYKIGLDKMSIKI
jgi:superoxide dismutase